MKKISDEIYQWSVFSEEKGLKFNGLYLQTAAGAILVDPPAMNQEELLAIKGLPVPKKIYLTNKHHTRAAAEFRKIWRAEIFVPEDDKSLMEIPVDGIFSDGELIQQEIEVINIPDSKTPGECAFHWPKKKVLIVGDAIIGKKDGLALLPDEKFKDPELAKQGLKVLRGLDFETLLLGDGESILKNARPVVEEFINKISPP